ncbi:hypothetical protein [Kitasatospora sp. P5_F3]
MSNEPGEPHAATLLAQQPAADPFAPPAPGDILTDAASVALPPNDSPDARSWSGLAVTSFVLSLVGFVLPLWALSAGFAVAALLRRRRRPQRGFGLAITSLVLAAGQFLVTVLLALLAWLVFTDLTTGPERGPDGRPAADGPASEWYLRAGDCLRDYVDAQQKLPSRVTVVSCDEPHRAEVYTEVSIPGGIGFPGEDAVSEASQRLCAARKNDGTLKLSALPDEAVDISLYPQAPGWWLAHDRETLCFFSSSKEWTGPLRQGTTG